MTELITAIETSGYEYIGIRHLTEDEHYSIGDICRDSYDWDCDMDCSAYDTDEPISLGGTCAYNTRIQAGWDEKEEIIEKLTRAIRESSCYYGQTVIIAEDKAEYGNDEGEIIISDAIVIEILEDELKLAA